MGTRIPSGPLHYFFQRSVVLNSSVGDHGADENPKLRNPNAQSFTHPELQKAMLETIASINQFLEEAGVTEVCEPELA
jgi:hypothetical protein